VLGFIGSVLGRKPPKGLVRRPDDAARWPSRPRLPTPGPTSRPPAPARGAALTSPSRQPPRLRCALTYHPGGLRPTRANVGAPRGGNVGAWRRAFGSQVPGAPALKSWGLLCSSPPSRLPSSPRPPRRPGGAAAPPPAGRPPPALFLSLPSPALGPCRSPVGPRLPRGAGRGFLCGVRRRPRSRRRCRPVPGLGVFLPLPPVSPDKSSWAVEDSNPESICSRNLVPEKCRIRGLGPLWATTSVEVLGRYSNPCHQGERIQNLLEMVPAGPKQAKVRTLRQVQHRLRSDEVEELLTRYRTGGKLGELATVFGVHRDTVSEILDRQGVPRRQRGIPLELVEEAIAAYRSGSSLATIGAEMSVDPGTVALTLRKAGVPLRRRRGSPR
jgi:hypothetical protein